jgi:hypothetical protein
LFAAWSEALVFLGSGSWVTAVQADWTRELRFVAWVDGSFCGEARYVVFHSF